MTDPQILAAASLIGALAALYASTYQMAIAARAAAWLLGGGLLAFSAIKSRAKRSQSAKISGACFVDPDKCPQDWLFVPKETGPGGAGTQARRSLEP